MLLYRPNFAVNYLINHKTINTKDEKISFIICRIGSFSYIMR